VANCVVLSPSSQSRYRADSPVASTDRHLVTHRSCATTRAEEISRSPLIPPTNCICIIDERICAGQVEPPRGIEPRTCSLRGDRTPPTTGIYQRQQLQISHL
jgi:hypothetical protein